MRRLSTLWQQDSELQTLSAQAEYLNALQSTWETAIPPSLKRHCRAGFISNQRLTIYASSGAVATKLKLLASSLVAKLQAQGLEVTAIRVEVQVKSEPRAPIRAPRRLGGRAVSSLRLLADSMPDSPLREALLRLSQRK
jgi:hypothetical protein